MLNETVPLQVLQWSLLVFFLIPSVEAIMMVLGAVWAQIGYREAPEKFTKLIIQVTTVGKEFGLVQRTVNSIRAYDLPMPFEIWVAIEPGHREDYENADRVIVVPENFKCKPIDKARALEYTRLIRRREGLGRADVKILLVDDDTLPSRRYILKGFAGDYDICQGITVANRWFGVNGGWRHLLLSHMDAIRTRNCLVYCSCTQGVSQKPLFVHGEGLTMTGETEQIVTWDRPIVASDDLVFGTNAAHMGLSWGYFQAAIQLVSPWTFKEGDNQRWRWTWGNFDAIGSRDIMPRAAAAFKGVKYALGFVSVLASTTGAVLLFIGVAKVPPQAHVVFWISLACWFGSYMFSTFIATGGEPNRTAMVRPLRDMLRRDKGERPQLRRRSFLRYWGFRIVQTILGGILTPYVALAPIVLIVRSVFRGRPNKFVMIDKTGGQLDDQLDVNTA